MRRAWQAAALTAGITTGLLLTATQAPHAPNPRPAYYLVTETP